MVLCVCSTERPRDELVSQEACGSWLRAHCIVMVATIATRLWSHSQGFRKSVWLPSVQRLCGLLDVVTFSSGLPHRLESSLQGSNFTSAYPHSGSSAGTSGGCCWGKGRGEWRPPCEPWLFLPYPTPISTQSYPCFNKMLDFPIKVSF
jgi:hypothetical protein